MVGGSVLPGCLVDLTDEFVQYGMPRARVMAVLPGALMEVWLPDSKRYQILPTSAVAGVFGRVFAACGGVDGGQ